MINVSNDYKTQIYDDSTQTTCTVVYGAYDMTAKSRASATSNGKQAFSSEAQTLNTINNFNRYSDLEINNFILDGNTNIFPNNPSGYEWGWWSSAMSDASGTFSTNPAITYIWNENHTSVGITLTVNDVFLEFNVYWYDANNTLLASYNYTNSDLTKNIYEIEQGVENYRKVVIEVVQILPYHYAKIQDVAFGKEFTWQNEIVSITVEESLDIKMQRLSSNQAVITLNNIDNIFNKYNPNSKLAFLQEGQKMTVYNSAMINGSYEQVPLGEFYLTSWGSPSQFQVEFRCNDMLYKMNDMTYYTTLYSNASLPTVLNDVLGQYGNTVEYEIDASLNGVTLTGMIPLLDTRTALQHIAFACNATCKVNRYGKLAFKRISSTTPVDNIDYTKKMFAGDKEAERYNSVTLTQYSFSQGDNVETIFEGTLSGTATISFDSPIDPTTVSITGTYTTATSYTNSVKLTGTSGTIKITGRRLQSSEKNVEKYVEDTSVGITKKNMPVAGICLIATDTVANDVATWLLDMLQKYITNEFRWLSNPAIETGDFVTLQVDENITKTAIVTKNSFEYSNGALSEISEVTLW